METYVTAEQLKREKTLAYQRGYAKGRAWHKTGRTYKKRDKVVYSLPDEFSSLRTPSYERTSFRQKCIKFIRAGLQI